MRFEASGRGFDSLRAHRPNLLHSWFLAAEGTEASGSCGPSVAGVLGPPWAPAKHHHFLDIRLPSPHFPWAGWTLARMSASRIHAMSGSADDPCEVWYSRQLREKSVRM